MFALQKLLSLLGLNGFHQGEADEVVLPDFFDVLLKDQGGCDFSVKKCPVTLLHKLQTDEISIFAFELGVGLSEELLDY
jgi:hypothetical protein